LTKIDSIKAIISNCNSILKFFNRLHIAHSYYKEQLTIMKIKGENENIKENNDLQQTLSTDLSISQIIDLSLSAFLATNNILFESTTNRLALYERNHNLGNMKYNLISLTQQIVNEENSKISNNSYN
ncbi:2747_t:CDS:2, partial [Cetraspora pellucida]